MEIIQDYSNSEEKEEYLNYFELITSKSETIQSAVTVIINKSKIRFN